MKSLQDIATFIRPGAEWDIVSMRSQCLCDMLQPADVTEALQLHHELQTERARSIRRREQLTKVYRDRDLLRAQLKGLLAENRELRLRQEGQQDAR